jgi:hypothetical protein
MMQRVMIQADKKLIDRVKRRAMQRGVSFAQVVREGMEREVGEEPAGVRQPPLRIIGAFSSGRSDLSRRAGEDEYEPPPFRSS